MIILKNAFFDHQSENPLDHSRTSQDLTNDIAICYITPQIFFQYLNIKRFSRDLLYQTILYIRGQKISKISEIFKKNRTEKNRIQINTHFID